MTSRSSRRRISSGFSFMELIVVVAIIVVLAGLTVGGFNLVNQKNAREKAKVQIKLLENALEAYQSDNRSYPPSLDPAGDRGDEVLYKFLYVDGFEARDNGGVIYLPELDPNNNAFSGTGKGGQAWMQGVGAQARILDPWGNFYRYRSGESPGAQNPDFDLWSAGADGKTNVDPRHKDSLDDIKNF
jgi:prepilin-type N-terminal cleavage/methylation domain-containing protein